MAIDRPVEQRLATLEEAVADLRRRLPAPRPEADWPRAIVGSISDPAAFAEALAYGQAFREADRPADGPGDGG